MKIKLLSENHLTGTERKHIKYLISQNCINKDCFIKINNVKLYKIHSLKNNQYKVMIKSLDRSLVLSSEKYRRQTVIIKTS